MILLKVTTQWHGWGSNQWPGLPLGGCTPYIKSQNRLRTPKLHIKYGPQTSEKFLVGLKTDIEASCLQKKTAHIYQIQIYEESKIFDQIRSATESY